MRLGTVLWLLGLYALQSLPQLPALPWLALLPATLLLGALRFLRYPAWFLVAFCWAGWQADGRLAERPPAAWYDRPMEVSGEVVSLPERDPRRVRFVLRVTRITIGGESRPAAGDWRLNWYGDELTVAAGQAWSLRVQLRRPGRFHSPGAFDYGGWLYRQDIAASGYVREALSGPHPGRHWRARLAAVREGISERLRELTGPGPASALLPALAVGDRRAIDATTWDLLRSTGTAHLVAISGLHVGLVATGAGLLMAGLGRLTPMVARVPARKLGVLAALPAALAYALLAGLSLPTQRALIMTAVAACALLLDRPVQPSRLLCWALLAVTLFDSSALLSSGFWLSFAAVAAIFWALGGRLDRGTVMGQWLRLQMLLWVALLPVGATVFGGLSPWAVPANLAAVPWVAVVLLPALLLALILQIVGLDLLGTLQWAAWAADALWRFLEAWPAPGTLWPLFPVSLWQLLLAAIGVLCLTGPGVWQQRVPAVVLLLPLLIPMAGGDPGPRLAVLDCGKGFAAVLSSRSRVAVIDTGQRLGARSDAGRAVVLPYLRSQGLRQVDLLLLSAAQSRRLGGTRSIRESLPPQRVVVADPLGIPVTGAQPCKGVLRWPDLEMVLRPYRDADGLRHCGMQVTMPGRRIAIALPPEQSDGAHYRVAADPEGGGLLITPGGEYHTAHDGTLVLSLGEEEPRLQRWRPRLKRLWDWQP